MSVASTRAPLLSSTYEKEPVRTEFCMTRGLALASLTSPLYAAQ